MSTFIQRLMSKKKKQAGFSLLEVMIALVISNIALLGLVAGELKSVQYAYNSYQYTVSLIHANNTVERVLNDVCLLTDNRQAFNDAYINGPLNPSPNDGKYTLSFSGPDNPGETNAFTENFIVNISWVDERMTDGNDSNRVAVMANFPEVPSGCYIL